MHHTPEPAVASETYCKPFFTAVVRSYYRIISHNRLIAKVKQRIHRKTQDLHRIEVISSLRLSPLYGFLGSSFRVILGKQVVDLRLQIALLNSRLVNLTQDKQVEMMLLLQYVANIVKIQAVAKREGFIDCTLLKDAT